MTVFCSEACCKAFEEKRNFKAEQDDVDEYDENEERNFEDEDEDEDSNSYPESDSEFSVITQYTYVRFGKGHVSRQIKGYIPVKREIEVE